MAKKKTTKKRRSYAERLRAKQHKRAKEAASKNSGDPRIWIPTDGTHRIRILPPLDIENPDYKEELKLHKKNPKKYPKPEITIEDSFYMTHAYHFLRGIGSSGKGQLLWTPRTFEVDGKTVKDPLDEIVSQMYEDSRKTKDKELKSEAGSIKRKRQYFMNIILYTPDDEGGFAPEYRILKDASNDGKLIREICRHMGFPFYKDVQEEWVDAETLKVDEDRVPIDLVDIESGHDFKIKRVRTGQENWDISYADSLPVKKARALTDEERELLDERVDLRSLVEYVDYNTIKSAIDEYFDESEVDIDSTIDESDDEEDVKEKARELAKKSRSKKNRPTPKDEENEDEEEDDESYDDLLDELDDDEDDEEWDDEDDEDDEEDEEE